MQNIKSRFAANVNYEAPLPEYPRPQFEREDWLNLNGYFDYAITNETSSFPEKYQGKIVVPFSIESSLSGVSKHLLMSERLWYRKIFAIPDEFKNKKIILNFGAIDWQCHIYVNKKEVGKHTGGYCSFSFNITEYLNDTENELIICVFDPTDNGHQQRGKQASKSHGIWYTATSGIWQTVWLEAISEKHIKSINLLPNIDKGCINVKSNVSANENYTLSISIFDDSKEIINQEISDNEDIYIKDFIKWSPENPHLYHIKLELLINGITVDSIKSYFGMRKFSIGNDKNGIPRLMLNNKPYFHNGLLDQGYWPESGLTPPTEEAMIYDIKTMKDLGFNMLRKHIKTENLRWYYHCDRLGMLVWQDMISGGDYLNPFFAAFLPTLKIKIKDNNYSRFHREKAEWREEFENELIEIIDELYNCVSICCWVPFNEAWGQFDAKRIGNKVKKYDNSRTVDHASGWYDQNGPELKSIHRYILPVRLPKPEERPFVLSEFGGYSMVIDKHVWNKKMSFGYKMYKSKDTLTKAYAKLFEKQIIPLIEKGLSATVYTQVSDVEFEVNGILTYDRDIIKIDEKIIKAINERMKF